jgi:hypothetical protein
MSVAAAAQLPSSLAQKPCSSICSRFARVRVYGRTSVAAASTGGQQVETVWLAQEQHAEATNPPTQHQDAVQLLERSYQQQHASSSPPQPSSRRVAAGDSKLRPLYIRSALPILRTIRFTERRLESDLLSVAATVMLVVGYIIWDRGVEEMLDNLLGDGPKGSVVCILFGLGLVVAVRVAGGKVSKLFSI